MKEQIIKELFHSLKEKSKISEKVSYTSFLLKNRETLAKKIGEESSELIIDFVKKNKEGVVKESADLIYHLLVTWIAIGINPDSIWKELANRKSKSGFEEKKNRGLNHE